MTSATHYGYATRLDSERWQGGTRWIGGRAMCSDGRVRALYRCAPFPDYVGFLRATVRVQNKNIAGYVTHESAQGSQFPDDDDPCVLKFCAFTYGVNHNLLPDGLWRLVPQPATQKE